MLRNDTLVGERHHRRFSTDRRRFPGDVREADVGEARAPNSDDAADWIAWLSDQSAGGYADITVPGERILELVRALEDPASAALISTWGAVILDCRDVAAIHDVVREMMREAAALRSPEPKGPR